jgi:hypothetical protein
MFCTRCEATIHDGERGTVSESAFFAAMMAHISARVRTIEAYWSQASGLTTNLDQLNQATAAGLSVEEPAPLTWTGRRASAHGYGRVTVLQALPQGAQGRYDTVRIFFSP